MALIAVTGVVMGGAYAARRRQRQRDDRRPETVETPAPQPADEPVAEDPVPPPAVSRPPVRPGFILALLAVLALAAGTAMHLSDPEPTALPGHTAVPDSPPRMDSPLDTLRRITPVHPGYPVEVRRTGEPDPGETPQPPAVVYPGSLTVGGMACAPGAARPVLDTVRPELSARMTGSGPVGVELTKEDATELVAVNRDDLMIGDGYVTQHLYGSYRLERGESYRWRIRAEAATGEWSPWCAFSIATSTVDSLNLDDDRRYSAGLPPATWQAVSAVLDGRFWDIQEAGWRVSAGDVPVSMEGRHWDLVIESMAEQASALNDAELWRLTDTLSVKLGGPARATMGFTRI